MDSLLSFQIHGGADHDHGLLDTLLGPLTLLKACLHRGLAVLLHRYCLA